MLRKFIQCANINERLAMVRGENAAAWTAEELEAAMEIVGASTDEDTKEAKLAAIVEALGKNAKEALSDAFVSRARKLTDFIPDAGELPDSDYTERMRGVCVMMVAQQQAAGR